MVFIYEFLPKNYYEIILHAILDFIDLHLYFC